MGRRKEFYSYKIWVYGRKDWIFSASFYAFPANMPAFVFDTLFKKYSNTSGITVSNLNTGEVRYFSDSEYKRYMK